ncbi:hypothetical protein D3C73_1300090 [compost metagenome]
MIRHINDFYHFTLHAGRGPINHRSTFQISIETLKYARFVNFRSGNHPYIIRFSYHLLGKDIDTHGPIVL